MTNDSVINLTNEIILGDESRQFVCKVQLDNYNYIASQLTLPMSCELVTS